MTRLGALVLGVLATLFLAACDASVYSLPLPGGPDVGEDPMTVKVEFADVLDLVPQSTVKVNDVSVGKVSAIDLEGYQAPEPERFLRYYDAAASRSSEVVARATRRADGVIGRP